jgi:hypothetical protein
MQANLGAIKVLLPNITEWTLDYTNACLWLRTPLAWYTPALLLAHATSLSVFVPCAIADPLWARHKVQTREAVARL